MRVVMKVFLSWSGDLSLIGVQDQRVGEKGDMLGASWHKTCPCFSEVADRTIY